MGEHKACIAPVRPRRASRHTRVRLVATAAGRPASDYQARRVRKVRKEQTGQMALGMKVHRVLMVRHLANKQMMYRWLRIGGCGMQWESRRRTWPAPAGCQDLSPVHMCSAVVDGLVVEVVSLV